MSRSNNPFRHPRPKPQDSVPEDDTRPVTSDRRGSLVRSNAIHRKSGSPISSKTSQPDFSFLPEHWKDTLLQPSNAFRDSNPHVYLQKTRSTETPNTLPPDVPSWIDSWIDDGYAIPSYSQKLEDTPESSLGNPEEDELPIGTSSTCLDKKSSDSSPETDSIPICLAKDIKDIATVAEDPRSELQDYKRLVSSLGPALRSRRGVLLLKTMQYQQQNHPSSVLQGGSGIMGLDDVLSISEAADIGQSLDARPKLLRPDSTCVRMCALCNLPRFVRVLSAQTLNTTGSQSEFSSEYSLTKCCRQKICDHCFVPAILSSITENWWYDLTNPNWIKCTVTGCHSPLPFFDHGQVSFLLRQLGDKEYTLHMDQFQKCSNLRDALIRHSPRPTEEALRRAAALHRQLAQHGRMHNPLSPDSPPSHTIVTMSVDSATRSHTLQIPIFTDQFILSSPRECIVCTDSPPDVVKPTQEDEYLWSTAIANFPGTWTSQIRSFPSPSDLPTCSASHPMNICRTCLNRHITTQLDTRGVSAPLTCPFPNCNHAYTHDEVRLLVSPSTFTRYDKLKLLSNLSTQPDFRWCLREGCGFGQIYQILDQLGDGPLDRRRNRVECEECSFEMCFKHQIPWHRGLSCVEYDRMKDAGVDVEDQATREWLRSNTKVCRCGAYVEKRGGCFHMKCKACGFEYCWGCMVDWNEIQPVDRRTGQVGRYNKDKHGEGCYFRGEGAILPTQIRGDSIEEALERLRG